MVSREDMPFFCSPCFIVCNSQKNFDQHCNGKAHFKKCKQNPSTDSSFPVETTKMVPETFSCSVCNLTYKCLNSFIKHCNSIEHAKNILNNVKVQKCKREISQNSHCTSKEEEKQTYLSCDHTNTDDNQMLPLGSNSIMDNVDRLDSKIVPSPGTCVPQEESVVHPSHNFSMNIDGANQNKDILYCTVCDVPVMGFRNYREHIKGSKHLKLEAKQFKEKSSDIGMDDIGPVHQRDPAFHLGRSQVSQRQCYSHNDKHQISYGQRNFQKNNKQLGYQNSLHNISGRQAHLSTNETIYKDCACHSSGKHSGFAAAVDHGSAVHSEGDIPTALGTTQTNCESYSLHMGANQIDLMKNSTHFDRCQGIHKHPKNCMGTSQPNLENPSCQTNGIPFFCSTCSIICNSRKSLNQHYEGKAHKKMSEKSHGTSSSTDALKGTTELVSELSSCSIGNPGGKNLNYK